MTLFKNKYRIESSRLKGWDYTRPGAYFITICTRNMVNHFGEIEIDNKLYSMDEIRDLVKLNEYGRIVKEEWLLTESLRDNVIFDEFEVMPNHFHGIVFILNQEYEKQEVPNDIVTKVRTSMIPNQEWIPCRDMPRHASTGLKKNSLGSIINHFKGKCTKSIHKIGNIDFQWQASFHDHIIRNEKSLNRIRDYIIFNPIKWKFDKYYRKSESIFP